MNERTRTYLRGRFRDYYRRHPPSRDQSAPGPTPPPATPRREWAYIPFASGTGVPMVRHRAVVDDDDLAGLLIRHRPRHVYHSAATYDTPDADSMGAKGWRGADLVFDLDADHLEGVDPDRTDVATMLARCKEATVSLLELLDAAFAFEDVTVAFSGNRGYHVHVRDPAVRPLGRDARREIAEYVRGIGLSYDAIVATETVAGPAGSTTRRRLRADGGWGRRVHRELVAFGERLRELPSEEAIEALSDLEGVGPRRAERVDRIFRSRWDAIDAGEIDLHEDFVRFVRAFVDDRVAGSGPAIDDPVTTDVHRLIRLPGSLHGKTGLMVTPLDRDDLGSFDPLRDAIAPVFRRQTIAIDVTEPRRVTVGGEARSLDTGRTTVPEYVGIYLMAREVAEKVRE